jgi:uncharacterized protein (DUF1015 family)
MAGENPNSFLRVNKAELEFDQSVNPYSKEVYQRSKENLERLELDGIMVRDEKPSFYLYRITMNDKAQTGLIALTSVEEYDQGLIKRHEHIRPEKMNDRADHMEYIGAQVGPVFSTFRFDEAIHALFNEITQQQSQTDFIADDGVRHELWVVDDASTISKIVEAFARLSTVYIADGHHRSAASSEVCRRYRSKNSTHSGGETYNFFLNVLFPDKELNILPYNRVVRDMNGHTLDQLLDLASKKFEISTQSRNVEPDSPHHFGMYCEGKWFLLKSKPGSFDAADVTLSIDASILGENFISPILGIDNPKTDKRINFVGGIRGTEELVRLVDSDEYKIAFSLYPTSIKQLLDVADAGEVMPPKSTWFEPKLRSGMVVNLLTD